MSYNNIFNRFKLTSNQVAISPSKYITEDPYNTDKLMEHFRKYPDKLQEIIVQLRKDKIEKIRNK